MIRLIAPLAALAIVIWLAVYALKPKWRPAAKRILRGFLLSLLAAGAVLLFVSFIFLGQP